MFGSGKVKIRFTEGNFTSPILGNVWVDREAVLDRKTAERFIKNNQAVLVDDSGNAEGAEPGSGTAAAEPAAPEKEKSAEEEAHEEHQDDAPGDEDQTEQAETDETVEKKVKKRGNRKRK
jgi:hypothetical protein